MLPYIFIVHYNVLYLQSYIAPVTEALIIVLLPVFVTVSLPRK